MLNEADTDLGTHYSVFSAIFTFKSIFCTNAMESFRSARRFNCLLLLKTNYFGEEKEIIPCHQQSLTIEMKVFSRNVYVLRSGKFSKYRLVVNGHYHYADKTTDSS